MSFNGSGTFLINSTGQPVVANTVISATVFNALTADLASGLTNCITKDGQSTPTANIPMGSNKITGLANGTLTSDAATLGQVQTTAAKLIGSISGVDTITGVMSPTLPAYAAGQLFYFVAGGANTGAVTLNIDSLGAKAVTRDGSTALAAGDINSGEMVVVIYDGTRFQMINAANSFGNTTINGTLTVTGNTALQANVSITSTLSVGGTFAVTGAATLGSTLAVTGKSDLPTVSTASINAAVAVVTTGTVTNLTSTSASIASVNAGVALLTTATVTDLTATGASIASANIGNLQFTAASIASINAGVAVVTNLTATSASIASANVGTAVVTTGTVTNLTSTSASIASANAAVALVTTGTVTNLTSTAASIASANLGNAVATTLTATGASIASANVGTAVVTGLTVTNASIASLNAGTATITTGNLTFSSTGQRITGDMSNATAASRLFLQSSTTNGNTNVGIIPNGTGTISLLQVYSASDPENSSFLDLRCDSAADSRIRSGITGTGTYLPMAFHTGGSERMRLDTSGNLGIGTASPSYRLQVSGTAVGSAIWANVTNTDSTTAGSTAGFFGDNGAVNTVLYAAGQALVGVTGTTTNHPFLLYTNGSERMRIDSSGNVGIGTASPSSKLQISNGTAVDTQVQITNSVSTLKLSSFSDGSGAVETTGAYALRFFTDATERMRVSSNGNVGIGGTANADTRLHVLGTAPSSSGNSRGVLATQTIPSSTTGNFIGYGSLPSTQASAFTLSTLLHFWASQSTLGAGSTVTNQYGFYAESSLTGATNNYGFYSNIASGSNRWNFYAAGTAANYFAGNVGIGVSPSYPLQVATTLGTTNGVRLTNAGSGTYLGMGLRYTGVNSDDNSYIQSSSSLAFLAPGYRFTAGETSTTVVLTIGADGSLTAPNVYDDTVGGTNRDLYIDNTGLIGYVSSVRASKTNIENLNDVSWLNRLNPVRYQYRKKDAAGNYTDEADGAHDYGLIAEDVQAVAPDLCFYDKVNGEDELRGVTYSKLITPMLKYIQQLEARIATLEAK